MAKKLDLLLAAFAVLMLAGASSSYRERALLPLDTDAETGLLGRELQELDLTEALSLEKPDAARFLPKLVRDALGSPGSRRRNIAALPSGQPITTSPNGDSVVDQSGSDNGGPGEQLALANTPTGGVGGGAGQGDGIGGGPGPSLGGGGGSGTAVSLLDPEDPTIDPELPINPPPPPPAVPEPAVWLMFLLGLFFTGAALRRRAALGDQLQSV